MNGPHRQLTLREIRERALRHPITTPPAYLPPLAVLLVRGGRLAGQRLTLQRPVGTLGRGSHNDLQLPDPSVSATHARLELRQGVWILTAIASKTETRVDGEPVSGGGEAPLSPGSTILLGEVPLFFEPRDPREDWDGLPMPSTANHRHRRRSGSRTLRRALIVLAVLLGAMVLLGWLLGFGR